MKKFTNLQKDCMKKLYINKLYTIPDIAHIFNCTIQYIYKILNIKSTLNKNSINNLSNNQIVVNKKNTNNNSSVKINSTSSLLDNNSDVKINNLLTGDK